VLEWYKESFERWDNRDYEGSDERDGYWPGKLSAKVEKKLAEEGSRG
jgi:hypothetical protein